MPPEFLLVCCATASLFYACFVWTSSRAKRNPKRLPYPPGPKALPLLGNLLDIATAHPIKCAEEWAHKYGDVVYLDALGNRLLYLNSLNAVNDLLEKRSAIYSSRPHVVMLIDLMSLSWVFANLPYGSKWRRQRKIFHQIFSINAVKSYQQSQLFEARKLLYGLLHSPELLFDHIRHSAASTILRVTYGITDSAASNEFESRAEEAFRIVMDTMKPGRFLVEILPILKYVPKWLPGAGFKRYAKFWGKTTAELRDDLFNATKTAAESKKAVPCAVLNMMNETNSNRRTEEEEDLLKGTALAAYAAGTDTTACTLQHFILAMALHPNIQRKAHTQLDLVIGNDRLPDFDDKPSLPYLEAIVMEVLRWHPAAPIGVPHRLDDDDEYGGYFIPKGTIVFANVKAILLDEKIYPDPLSFRPERFLDANGQIDPSVPHPEIACFGFGRRVCPGKHMAHNAVFIAVISILSSFVIEPALDEDGNNIPIVYEMGDEIVSFPKHFECTIKPRSKAKRRLIEQCAIDLNI